MDCETQERADYRSRIYERYATNFQDAPQEFDVSAASRWGRAYRHYLRGWLPNNRNALILDVACGGGKLLHFFKQMGYANIAGVDISHEQVSLARQVTPKVAEANVIDYLEANPEGFDLITGFDIVEHLTKPEVMRFLNACFIALKPGGRLILHTPNADSPWGMASRYGDFTHEVGFNANSLTRLLKLSEFKEIGVREIGPVPIGHSLFSSFRFILWQCIRLGLKIWNYAEIGHSGSNVFTRVFVIACVKKNHADNR